jgi:probable rRNA maturation factor
MGTKQTGGRNNSPDLEVTAETVNLAGRDLSAVESDLRALAPFVLSQEGQRGRWIVSFALTTDEHLRDLHREFMGIDEETDVMTFPLDGNNERGGDIVISVDRAAEQAAEAGHSLSDEIRFLAVHGLLHLCGWDDRDDPSREAMLARQSALIQTYLATASDSGLTAERGAS